jgi:hypothetical protein
MNGFDVLQLTLLGINGYLAYRVCSVGGRCGVALTLFLLNVFAYVGSRMRVDASLVALAVAVAFTVALVVISE